MTIQAAAELQQKMAAFLAAGGAVQILPGFERTAPLPARTDPPPTVRQSRRNPVGIKRPRPKRDGLVDDHVARIRELAKTKTAAEVAADIGYALSTVKACGQRHSIIFQGMRWRPYSKAEIAAIREAATTLNMYQAADKFGRTRSSLRAMAKREGITFKDGVSDSRTALTKFNRSLSQK
ncbi:hypothetical protein [Pseudomonas sp. ML96]|uniref:hypothetical protein n=1 Tax=Pseudomonas sp. ML96 TaxID=1523503 RepID=UPI0005BBE474|nr:hypothetical protein [Pseudomonas sp. ML96]